LNVMGPESLDANQKWALEAGEREDRRQIVREQMRRAQVERESIQQGRAIERAAEIERLDTELAAMHEIHLDGLRRTVALHNELVADIGTDLEARDVRLAMKMLEHKEEIARCVDAAVGPLRAELQTEAESAHHGLMTALRTVGQGLERTMCEGEKSRDDAVRKLEDRMCGFRDEAGQLRADMALMHCANRDLRSELLSAARTAGADMKEAVREGLAQRDAQISALRGEITTLSGELTEMRTETSKARAEELAAVHRAMLATVQAAIEGIDDKRARLVEQAAEQDAALKERLAEADRLVAKLRRKAARKEAPFRFAREKAAAEALEVPSEFLPASAGAPMALKVISGGTGGGGS
jgi:hypothetical protein